MGTQDYDAFVKTRYWPQLDGLRVISIAVVLIAHMGDYWVPTFKGALGVIIFFVISGFLITSLLIREEMRTGRVSIGRFYVRRIFRIVPLYALALAVATALVLVGGFGDPSAHFLTRLPLLATFNGDLAGGGTFVHSWSIGVEEKFYILWPLIAFAFLPLRRLRVWIASVLFVVCLILAFVPAFSYFGVYVGILAGCLLSIALHDQRAYAVLMKLATPWVGACLLLLAVLAFLSDIFMPWTDSTGFAHPIFAITVACAFPAILLGSGTVTRFLSRKWIAFVGTRAYGIYLFHPFVIDVVDRVVPAGQTSAGPGLVRLVVASVLSFVLAELLYRTIEGPLIRVGRRITKSSAVPETVESTK